MLRVPSEIAATDGNRSASRRGVIRGIRRLTNDVAHFDLYLAEPMDFEAGQFVVLATGDLFGGRAYSMVNFDNSAAKVAFVMKRKPGGAFSDWLFARKDDEVQVEVLDRSAERYFVRKSAEYRLHRGRLRHSRDDVDPRAQHTRAGHFRSYKGAVFFGCEGIVRRILP